MTSLCPHYVTGWDFITETSQCMPLRIMQKKNPFRLRKLLVYLKENYDFFYNGCLALVIDIYIMIQSYSKTEICFRLVSLNKCYIITKHHFWNGRGGGFQKKLLTKKKNFPQIFKFLSLGRWGGSKLPLTSILCLILKRGTSPSNI